MATVIIQSYRPYDVPQWIQSCMASVKRLCELRGWDYKFEGDEFLDRTPKALQGTNLWATTDYSRLQWLRECLETYDTAIWFDADVYVFKPTLFDPTTDHGYAFSHELLSYQYHSVNNAVMIFETAGVTTLDKYIRIAKELLESGEAEIDRTALGPSMLKGQTNLLHGVGLFTTKMMTSIANGDMQPITAYEHHSQTELSCANLCHFMRDRTKPEARFVFDLMYQTALENLHAYASI